jgi:hypothetical protein
LQQINATGAQVNYNTSGLPAYSGNAGDIRADFYQVDTIGFYSHTTSGSFQSITYDGCFAVGCGAPFQGADADTTYINNCGAEQFFVALKFAVADLQVNTFDAQNIPPIVAATAYATDATNISAYIRYSNFKINTTGYFRIAHTGCTLLVDNTSTHGFNTLAFVNVANCTLTLTNNNYVPEGRQSVPYNIGAGATGLTFVSDFNAFNGESDSIVYLGTSYPTFDAYKTASGQDTHSTP